MAKTKGRLGTLELSIDAGANYYPIGRLKDGAFSIDGKEIDMTDHDSGAWDEVEQGRSNWRITAPCFSDEADTGQVNAAAAKFANTACKARWRMKGAGTGNRQWVGDCFVLSIEQQTTNEGMADMTITLRGTGAPVASTQ